MKLFDIDLETLVIPTLVLGLIYFLFIKNKSAIIAPVVPIPAAPTAVTSASQLMTSETLNIGSAGGLVIWIPNEAHEPLSGRLSPKNGVFLPMKAIIPTGCQVAWVSDDATHSHTVNVTGIGSTKAMEADVASEALTFPRPGTFSYKSNLTPEAGTITVTSTRAIPGKVIGAFFAPTGKTGAAGIQVLSTSNFGKDSCSVYSAVGSAAEVAARMTTVTKMTPYT
jgi:plastocyanin